MLSRGAVTTHCNAAGGYAGRGSECSDAVLRFDPGSLEWQQVGRLQVARTYHGASVVSVADIREHCQ